MPRGRYRWCWDLTKDFSVKVLFIILLVATAAFWILGTIFGTKDFIRESRDIRQKLLSKVTANSPISGFYGPGTWWAWLITLGMAHGHAGLALGMTGDLPPEWDYDLVGASAYAVAAAIYLTHKSRQISQLGDQASESALIPALVYAERVVAIGAGSSLISVIVALIVRSTSGLRTAGIAIIPTILALVASDFTLRAHHAIAQTAPVFWCDGGHGNDTKPGVIESIATIHFPANLRPLWSWGYLSYGYRWGVGIVLAITAVAFHSLAKRRGLRGTLWSTARVALFSTAIFWTLHIIWPLFLIGLFAVALLGLSIMLWWPVYILAFFPQLQFFPVSATSIFEMDQIAALLAVVAVTVIRIARPIFKSIKSVRSARAAVEPDLSSSHEFVSSVAE